MSDLLLIGGGGHCKSCIDVIETSSRYKVFGVIDESIPIGDKLLGYPILGNDQALEGLLRKVGHAIITIGQIKTPHPRVKLFHQLKGLGAVLPSIVSNKAYVSKRAELGAGTMVFHGAIVNASARVGDNCILNTFSQVEHDVTVGDHCHIATGARVNGNVVIVTNHT